MMMLVFCGEAEAVHLHSAQAAYPPKIMSSAPRFRAKISSETVLTATLAISLDISRATRPIAFYSRRHGFRRPRVEHHRL
jgi:hypothetical protein